MQLSIKNGMNSDRNQTISLLGKMNFTQCQLFELWLLTRITISQKSGSPQAYTAWRIPQELDNFFDLQTSIWDLEKYKLFSRMECIRESTLAWKNIALCQITKPCGMLNMKTKRPEVRANSTWLRENRPQSHLSTDCLIFIFLAFFSYSIKNPSSKHQSCQYLW